MRRSRLCWSRCRRMKSRRSGGSYLLRRWSSASPARLLRHCERSEATQPRRDAAGWKFGNSTCAPRLDGFASLAMTAALPRLAEQLDSRPPQAHFRTNREHEAGERMSPGDRAEQVAHLRRAVARIENTHGPRAARAERLSVTRALDRRLGGGLPSDGLCEIAPAAPADATAAFGFALALAARFMAGRGAGLLVIEDFAHLQGGVPVRARACRAWARSFPPYLRARARRVVVVPDDGGRVEKRRARCRDRRSLALGEIRSLRFPPSDARRPRRADAGAAGRADGAWAGAFDRGRDALRDRGQP